MRDFRNYLCNGRGIEPAIVSALFGEGFSMGAASSRRLYIFQNAIDAMSHGSMENIIASDENAWQRDARLAISCESDAALAHFLKTHPAAKELVLCLDNDEEGRKTAVALARKYAEKGFITRLELSRGKTCNEDLLAYRRKQDGWKK